MLREITPIRSYSFTRKRWFSDTDMDLFIWFLNQTPIQFQLTYNKQNNEHAICWDSNSGFSHDSVDDGEQNVSDYKMAPLLSPVQLDDDEFDVLVLAREFLQASENIDASLADFIYARLLEFPRQSRRPSDRLAVVTND
jgi:hypothetical protein